MSIRQNHNGTSGNKNKCTKVFTLGCSQTASARFSRRAGIAKGAVQRLAGFGRKRLIKRPFRQRTALDSKHLPAAGITKRHRKTIAVPFGPQHHETRGCGRPILPWTFRDGNDAAVPALERKKGLHGLFPRRRHRIDPCLERRSKGPCHLQMEAV